VLRRLIEVSTAVVTDAFEGRKLASELLDEAEGKIFQIGQAQGGASFTRIKELPLAGDGAHRGAEQGRERGDRDRDGFRDLDEMTSGFQPSDLVIVAAARRWARRRSRSTSRSTWRSPSRRASRSSRSR
jgi:replicative DNA helicase